MEALGFLLTVLAWGLIAVLVAGALYVLFWIGFIVFLVWIAATPGPKVKKREDH